MAVKKKSGINVKTFIGIILIIAGLSFIILYEALGLKYYINAMSMINSATPDDKQYAYDMLSSSPESNYGYDGILAYVNTKNGKFEGVWIWGLKGLKYFKGDATTMFSNFKICEKYKIAPADFKVIKNFNIGYSNWKSYAKVGDFVGVFLSNPQTSGISGKLQEVYSYDWWVFLRTTPPGYLENTCKNR